MVPRAVQFLTLWNFVGCCSLLASAYLTAYLLTALTEMDLITEPKEPVTSRTLKITSLGKQPNQPLSKPSIEGLCNVGSYHSIYLFHVTFTKRKIQYANLE
eukprot:TCONS_00041250-protein